MPLLAQLDVQITQCRTTLQTLEKHLNDARLQVMTLQQQLATESGALNALLWVQHHLTQESPSNDDFHTNGTVDTLPHS